jgi:hypothetical protein
MVQSSAYVTQIALQGAARVRQGETPELKNPTKLSKLQGEQNIDFFESSLKELQARDNQDGQVSIHVFSSGQDQDPAVGKLKVGNLEAEFEGDSKSGTRFSVEARGDADKIKVHRFEDSKIVVFEATVKPDNEMNSSVLILDRENPEESVMGKASTNWLLSL